MKKSAAILVTVCLLIVGSGYFSMVPGATTDTKPVIASFEIFILDTVTIYNPSVAQCDMDPLVTASNKRINTTKLKANSLRWMALSRNMLKRWGGKLHYGDTVWLHAGDQSIDGQWVIQDTMNKRYENRGDLLFDASTRSAGMWTGVTIAKRKTYRDS